MITFDESFFRLQIHEDGKQVSRDYQVTLFNQAIFKWARWAKGFRRSLGSFTVRAYSSGRAWSGAWFPAKREVAFSTDWKWNPGSFCRVAAHEIGHVAGITDHFQGKHIMMVGAPGVLGEVSPFEVNWLLARYEPNRDHNYHPHVMSWLRSMQAAQRRTRKLKKRARQEGERIRELKTMAHQNSAKEAELRELIRRRRVRLNCLNTAKEIEAEWDDWTPNASVLRLIHSYGSRHKRLFPNSQVPITSKVVPSQAQPATDSNGACLCHFELADLAQPGVRRMESK